MDLVEGVLYGADADIIEMVRQRIPEAAYGFTPAAVGLGVVRHGRLLGGVVFDQYTEENIFVSIAFDSPAWCTRKILRRLFSYPFGQLGVRRMTAVVAEDNSASRSAVVRLGFEPEGVLRRFFPGDKNAHLFGLLNEDCRWLKD